jgi:hypothetical protein
MNGHAIVPKARIAAQRPCSGTRLTRSQPMAAAAYAWDRVR